MFFTMDWLVALSDNENESYLYQALWLLRMIDFNSHIGSRGFMISLISFLINLYIIIVIRGNIMLLTLFV
jgi:hypothetical protein